MAGVAGGPRTAIGERASRDETKMQKLQELELTTEVDSLELVELTVAMEEAFGITFENLDKFCRSQGTRP
jgi:acyl carrier protein